MLAHVQKMSTAHHRTEHTYSPHSISVCTFHGLSFPKRIHSSISVLRGGGGGGGGVVVKVAFFCGCIVCFIIIVIIFFLI